jgi:hypothetical protein
LTICARRAVYRLRGRSAVIHAIFDWCRFEPAPEIGPASVIVDSESPTWPSARSFILVKTGA